MKRSIITFLLAASVLLTGGCNHLPRGTVPEMQTVFDRFDRVVIGESTSADVFSFIQNKSMGELLSQDDQTIMSWAQNGDGAVMWLNAVSFDENNDTAARKYAFLVDEDSPGWRFLYGAKSKKMRAEFEFVLPPEFDELEITTENERRSEALKAAISLYRNDINTVRYDSNHIYASEMMMRQLFSELIYELERVPAYLSIIDAPEGVKFDHPTLGPGRARMIFDTETYIVRIKVKVGKSVKTFATDEDVLAMGNPVEQSEEFRASKMSEQDKEKQGWDDWIKSIKPKKQKRSAEELEEIEKMAREQAAKEIEEMNAEQNSAETEVDTEPAPSQEEPEIEPELQEIPAQDQQEQPEEDATVETVTEVTETTE